MNTEAGHYDHRDKAGNRGDLIKHFVLCTAVHRFALNNPRFSYLDVHSGRAGYTLQADGAWTGGAGRFAELYARGEHSLPELDYFYRLMALESMAPGAYYPGSSTLVRDVLLDRQIDDFSLHLCENQPPVCASLDRAFAGDPRVQVYCEDGYSRAKQQAPLDLMFIDPPDMQQHFAPYMDLIRHCLAHRQPFISWNSLHGNAEGTGMSRRCAEIRALASQAAVPLISVRWTAHWTRPMCGCQMLLYLPGGEALAEACGAMTALMGWSRPL